MKFAALVTENVYVPEQGHGYPAYHTTQTGIRKFKDKAEMEKWVLGARSKNYELIQYETLKVTQKIDLEIEANSEN